MQKLVQSDVSTTRSIRLRVALLYVPITVATIFGFIASSMIGSTSIVMAGLGVVSYVFGLRHGLDADHIAAIDNTMRKMMQEGKRPVTVGTWFSLGHSTVVVGLILAFVFSTKAIASSIPALQSTGAILGTGISGLFLWVIGLINVAIVFGIYKIYKEMRSGRLDSKQLDEMLNKRGFLNRYFSSLFRIIEKPWHTYPIGLLFGLGFDTASEVALIAMSVGVGVSASVPLWMILILPLMFTCGMVMVDTTDSVTMLVAYDWAFFKPIRKIYYNLTITLISVLVAFLIGTVEIFQVLSSELGLTGFPWNILAKINFETFGYLIVGMFVVAWATSIAVYKIKKIDDDGNFQPRTQALADNRK